MTKEKKATRKPSRQREKLSLSQKIDFAVIFSVKNANPNGDPLNGNRPRVSDDKDIGEVTDVCIKRKIRDRLQELEDPIPIFVQSDEKKTDGMKSLQERAKDKKHGLGEGCFKKGTNSDDTIKKACEKWFDVRCFGQVFAFEKSVSISVRGPVTIQSAFSLKPLNVTSTQITKSVSGKTSEKKGPDTMGMKHRVDDATYASYGSMSPQLAERTGFSDNDAEKIKEILPKLFEGDASAARPEGSMRVEKVVWWKHETRSGVFSSARIHDSLRNILDGEEDDKNLLKNVNKSKLEEKLNGNNGVKIEVIDGFY